MPGSVTLTDTVIPPMAIGPARAPPFEAAPAAARGIDSGLACFIMLLRFLSIPADPEQIRHQFGRADTVFVPGDILRAAKRIGVKARAVGSKWSRLPKIPLPAIAERQGGGFFIIAKVAGDKVLVQDPQQNRPQSWTSATAMRVLKSDRFSCVALVENFLRAKHDCHNPFAKTSRVRHFHLTLNRNYFGCAPIT